MRNLFDQIRGRLSGAARWLILTVAGSLLVAAGLIMLFTPGPGWGLIALGLYVWAKQFTWAQRALDRLLDWLDSQRHKLPKVIGRLIDGWRRRRDAERARAAQIEAARAERATRRGSHADRSASPQRPSRLDRTTDEA